MGPKWLKKKKSLGTYAVWTSEPLLCHKAIRGLVARIALKCLLHALKCFIVNNKQTEISSIYQHTSFQLYIKTKLGLIYFIL